MKKIMGQVTGKLSLSILTMFVLLVGVLAGLDKVTTTKASDSSKSTVAAVSTPASSVTTAKAVKAASNLNPAAKQLQVTKDLQTAREQAKKQPLVFEPNRGQSSQGVQYFARSAGYAVFMKSAASAVLEFRQDVKTAERVTMKLNGANEQAQSLPLEATGGVSNYMIGNDRSKWLQGIPNYTKVRYNNVYPGVDVVYQGDGMNFRHDFVVQPGADPKAIRLSYEGGHGMSVDEKGRLVVALARGSFSGSRPYVYQEYNGTKHEVSGNYVLTAQNDAQFEIGSYDRSQALIIDPGYTYASYALTAADNYETQITGVAMNSTVEVICGWTFSPTLDSALTGGQQQAFVGTVTTATLAASKTFVGGTTGNTQGNGCSLSTTGKTAMVGVTNSGTTFPGAGTLAPNPASNINFNKHAFVVETTGAATPAFSALIAGQGSDMANAVAYDKSGNIHIVGATSSGSQGTPTNNLLTSMVPAAALAKAAQPVFESKNSTNAFYMVLSSAKAVTYGTFLGGYQTDEANAVATDASGNAYITGDSTSWGRNFRWENFPIQAPQACSASANIGCIPTTNPPTAPITPYTFSSGKHAWVAAINPNASNTATPSNGSNGVVSPTLLYSLPIGGDINSNEQDIGTAITVDVNYNVYVGGNTQNPSLAGVDPRPNADPPAFPGTNNSLNNVVFTAPGVVCPSPLLNLTNDLESSTQNCTAGGNAAGPGVVAAFKGLPSGSGYTVADVGRSVTFSLPDLAALGGTRAQGFIGTVAGGVTGIVITNQGSGYTTPPTVTIPAPLAGGTTAQATVVVGAVVLGNPSTSTGIAQDGWVIQLNAPGLAPGNQTSGTGVGANTNNTFNFNGGTLKTATPVYAQFPAFVFATLVNGDENNGNGTGGARGVNPANCTTGTCPPNNINQVTGIVTDYGAIPGATAGSAGPLGNIYISGSSSSASGGSLRAAFDAVLIRRRINANAVDSITGNTLSTLTQTPFAPIYTAAEPGVINNLGDLDLGAAVPAGSGGSSASTATATAAALSGNPASVTVKLTITPAPPAGLVGKNVTVSGVVAGTPLTTITSAATPVFTGTGTIFTVTFTTPTLAPLLAVGQTVTLSGAVANTAYNVSALVLGTSSTPSAAAPTATTFTLAFPTNPGAFTDAAGAVQVNVANGYNGTFAVTAEDATSISYVVTTNPGLYGSGGSVAIPAIPATTTPAPIGTATGVAYDPATGRSCIGGWTGTALPSSTTKNGIFMPPPQGTAIGVNTFGGTTGVPTGFPGFFNGVLANANNAAQPGELLALNAAGVITATPLPGSLTAVGTVTEGIVACALYNTDVTLTSANPVISFQMVAGETALSTPALSTLNPLNQTTISITNPNGVGQASVATAVWYTPPPFGGSAQGPASGSFPANRWLHLDTTPGGTSYTLSLLDPLDPQEITPASRLDPGFYQATFNIVPAPGSGDNAGVPIVVTVNLTVTGTVLTNTVFAGGVPTPNAGPAPVGGAPVVLNEGAGWADVGNNTEYINIPIASQVPLLSPSNGNIVFDLLRDSNGNPVYTNSSTQWPVLGPPSTGGVQSLTITSPGSNYTCANGNSIGTPGSCTIPLLFCVSPPSATTQTCGAPTGGTQATGNAMIDPTTGTIQSYVITNAGSGYSNPPYVIFPLPNAGGTQAQALVNITTAPGTNPAGGVISLHPFQFGPFGNLIPASAGCGQFAPGLPDGLTTSNACYIQAQLPPTMLAGAPSGTYSGTFYLYVNSGQLNIPSFAPLTLPGGTTVTFSPVGSTGSLPNCPANNPGCNPPPGTVTPVAVTINVLVNPGTLTLQSPWISNVNPGNPAPPFVLNASILPPVPLAPFSVPVGYTGTITSSNNGLPYIPGITGNTADYHTLRLDSRNLLTGNTTGTFLATVTPGISASAAAALALSAVPPVPSNGLSSVSLPIATCTTSSPAIPSSLLGNTGILQFTQNGVLQAASASVTTTDITVSIVNPSSLAPGYYASTITYAALGPNGAPITNNNNQPISASLPVCLSVGNRLAYEYQVISPGFAAGNVLVSGQPPFIPTTGMLFMEAGTIQTLEADVYGLGPSQNVSLPLNVRGGPQFAPPDSTLQIPAVFSMLAGTPAWIAPTQIQPQAGQPFVGIEGGTNCMGTQPNNTCTPAAQQLVIAPPQATSPGWYPNPNNPSQFPAGGITVTDTPLPTQPLLAASNSPMNAVLPVVISSGPGLLYNTMDASATACNGTQPTGAACGTVFDVHIIYGGSGYTVAPKITFQGGHCAVEPTAFTTISGGAVNAIYLTSLGGGCQTAPIVNIDPPTVNGNNGNQALAAAVVSDGTITVNFTEQVGSLTTVPTSSTISVLPSRPGTRVDFLFPFPSLQSPTNPLWLAFAFSQTGCNPFVTFDPTQSSPGLYNGCAISVTPNLLAAGLPVGTYQAWQVLSSGPSFPPDPQPHYVTVLVTLNVVPQGGQPCSITLRDAGGNNNTTLPYTGTAMSNGAQNGGFYPSTGINLTVTPNSATACGNWTVSLSDSSLSLASPATGVGVGTITYNMQANTHLVARSSTITVTAGGASATYTVNEVASSLSQLQREVQALYQRALGREPDTGGYNFWTCTTPGTIQPCANMGIAGLGGMVDLFLGSSAAMGLNAPLNSPPGQASVGEGESSDFQVLAIYKAMLGRLPSFAEWATAVAPFRLNETPQGWALAATNLLNSVLNSQEYANNFGPLNVTNEVNALYHNALGRAPSGTELSNAISLVTNGGTGGLYNLFYNLCIAPPLSAPAPPNPPYPASADTSAEFQNRGSFATATDHSNDLFVRMLYYSILARDPDAGGFNFWLGIANGGGSGIYFQTTNTTRVLVEGPGTPNVGLVGSTEFQNTFNF